MERMQKARRIGAIVLSLALLAFSETYYIDSQNGNDGATGTSPDRKSVV